MRVIFRIFAVFLASICLAQSALAAPPPATPAKTKLLYVPATGADMTRTRVGTLIRAGGVDKPPLLSIVAPDHPGTTLTDQPQLYWYLSDTTSSPVEIVLIDEASGDRIYELSLKGAGAGFHCLDLAKEGTHLEVNKRYQFIVVIVQNAKNRAKDVVTSGFVKHVKASDELAKGIAGAQGMGRTSMLLSSGIWYDGMADLMGQIEAHKNDPNLVAARDALLKQVGLSELVAGPAPAALPAPAVPVASPASGAR